MNALFDAVILASIRNRYLVIAAAVAMLGVAAWSARDAHLDALPDFTPPMVVVQAEAPGLGSTTVERMVTTPLEQALLGIPHMARLRSTSSPGLSVLQLVFEPTTDIFRARQLVSERIAQARDRLPATLPLPRLAPITAPVGALLKLAYTTAGPDVRSLHDLWQFAQWTLRPRLQAIEGVSRVTVHGGASARIEVRLDPAAMLERHVPLADVRHTLATAQSIAALGHLDRGTQRHAIRADGTWTLSRLDAISNTTITSRHGLPVRVGDIARVGLGNAPALGAALYDGKPAIYLQIDKLPWADTQQVTERVERALANADAQLPPGAHRNPPVFRQADFIHASMVAVGRAMALGAVFVVLIVVLLLRSARLCAISLIALPLSIVAAITVLLLGGVTINGMILGGLAIAVGEVVDDAIVDVENIWRRLRENAAQTAPRPALEVIRDASAEVRSSVVYASLLVVVVLLPIMLLGGVAGRIFSPLAQTYALAVAASLVVALTLTPALSAALLPRLARTSGHEPRITRLLRRMYDWFLQRVCRWPGRIVLSSVALGAAACITLPFLGGGFLPEFREGVLIAEVTAWPGTSLDETTRLARRISRRLRQHAPVSHVAVRVGRASLDEDAAPVHHMEMDLVVDASGDADDTVAAVLDNLRRMPGVRFNVEGFLGERINELLSGERAPLAIKLYGADLSALRGSAQRLARRLRQLSGVEAVRSRGLVDTPTMDLKLDERRLAIAGVAMGQVIDTAAAWRQGLPVTEVKVDGGFAVPVVLTGPSGTHPHSLGDAPVFTSPATAVPLSSLATLRPGAEPPAIDHEGGRRVITVTARADSSQLSAIASRISSIVPDVVDPHVSWRLAGQAAERAHTRAQLAVTAALVLLAMLAFLWTAFGSLIDALVVLGGLPLGMVGGVAVALALPEGLSIAGLIGFVALAGVISRNGIMLVAHKNALARTAGEDSEQVVLQAALERLLPIVMTAATAFFGLLPLAASLGSAGSELEAPMAIVVCGGLVTATTLNLIAIPAFYVWRTRRGARHKRNVPSNVPNSSV